jgi:integrase
VSERLALRWSDVDWLSGKLNVERGIVNQIVDDVKTAADSGIGPLGTHAFRHTCRSWLDAVGTPIAVQQKLMRHSDIRTTINIYGSVVTDEMGKAGSRVVGLALRSAN